MKKIVLIRRLCAFLLCLVLMSGILPTSVFAAKEMFYGISSVAVSGIDAPEAGKYLDFTAEENSQMYNIIQVAWMTKYGNQYITDPYTVVTAGIEYKVFVVLEVTNPKYYFETGEGRVCAVSDVTVNGQTGYANNTFDYTLFMPDASKYEYDTTYGKYLTVMYDFPAASAEVIESFDLVIDPPAAGELPAKKAVITSVNGGENVGFINVDNITWTYQTGTALPGGTTFEYGENYVVNLSLSAVRSHQYAVDPNHFLAKPGSPFPAVTATINGKPATVLPDGDASLHIVVGTVLTCDGTGKITEVSASVTPPKAGEAPDYNASAGGTNYTVAGTKDRFTSGGVTWYNETESKNMYVGIDKFTGGNAYSVTVELTAADGYAYPDSGVSASVNGSKAEAWSRDNGTVYIKYTFGALPVEKHVCSPIKADEHKATCTEEGKKAHYFCPECGKFFEDSKCTKEITKINAWGVIPATGHSGGKATCAEKAKCKTCGAAYGDFAAHNYGSAWDYKDASGHAHTCKVCGGHDTVKAHTGGTADCGKKAKCSECKAEYGEAAAHNWGTAWDYKDASGHAHKCTVNGCDAHDTVVKHTPGAAATETSSQDCTVCGYIIEPAIQHKHQMVRTDAVDATCTTAGKKEYYSCTACSLISSDSKGAKEITDADSLIIPATGHKESKWKSDADIHWKECTVKGCGAAIEGTKQEHEFGKNDKCTVCNYKRETVTEEVPSPTTPETEHPATPDKTDPSVTPDKEQDTGNPPDSGIPAETVENTPPSPEEPQEDAVSPEPEPVNSSMIWIVIAAVIGVLTVSVILLTVLLVKKSKK